MFQAVETPTKCTGSTVAACFHCEFELHSTFILHGKSQTNNLIN